MYMDKEGIRTVMTFLYCRPSYEWTLYAWISQIIDKICCFWNFCLQRKHVKLTVLTVN